MPPDLCKLIERMGLIFEEMEAKKTSNPEIFDSCSKQAKDFGMANAFYYLCVEQELEEKGII